MSVDRCSQKRESFKIVSLRQCNIATDSTMLSNNLRFICTTTFLMMAILLVGKCNSKPWAQNINPLAQPAFLESGSMSCTPEIENICQRCAKQTKSTVVYPWCCTNHEGAREWCENYLFYGLR